MSMGVVSGRERGMSWSVGSGGVRSLLVTGGLGGVSEGLGQQVFVFNVWFHRVGCGVFPN